MTTEHTHERLSKYSATLTQRTRYAIVQYYTIDFYQKMLHHSV